MKKKVLSLLVVAVLLISVFAVTAITAGAEVAYGVMDAADATTLTRYCEHCGQEVTWTAWDGSSSLDAATNDGDHVYVSVDEIQEQTLTLSSDKDVVLNLNGKTITHSNRLALINAGAKLSIVDYSNADVNLQGTITAKGHYVEGESAKNTGVYQLYGENATLNIYGGNHALAAEHNTIAAGGVANVGSGTFLNVYGGKLVGGDITAGSASSVGGAVRLSGTMNMYGGEIAGGKAYTGGSVEVLSGAVLNIYGGTISGGEATHRGGNVHVSSGGQMYMKERNGAGGTITGGIAASGAGNILVDGTFEMDKGEITLGETTSGYGGNIRVNGTGSFTMRGGDITNGKAVTGGGNVWIYNTSGSMSGGTMSGGQTTSTTNNEYTGGGNLALEQGSFTLSGNATISGGKSPRRGCNVLLYASTLNMTGGTIKDNLRDSTYYTYGGNVFIAKDTSALNVTDGTISGGNTSYGGNIYANAGTITIEGTVTGGYATNNGGNIYANTGTITIEGTGVLSNGIAQYNGANMYLGNTGTGTTTLYIKDQAQIIANPNLNSENTDNATIASYSDTYGSIYLTGYDADHKVVVNMTGGTLTGGKTTRGGANVQMGQYSEFNMSAGTITGGNMTTTSSTVPSGYSAASDRYVGGSVHVGSSTATFNLSGTGEITGGEGYNGGNVGIPYGTFNMTGGTISNGNHRNYGGNVMVQSTGTFNMTGGTVSTTTKLSSPSGNMRINDGGTLKIGGTANINGGINLGSAGIVTLSGTPVIMRDPTATNQNYAGLYVTTNFAQTLDVSGLQTGARIAVSYQTADTTKILANNVTAAQLGYFQCKNDGYSFIADASSNMVMAEGHWHCVCGGTLAGTAGHSCEIHQWTAMSALEDNSVPDGGYYYLDADETAEVYTGSYGNKVVSNSHLCLNGNDITADSGRALTVYYSGSSLTVCDHPAGVDTNGNITYGGTVSAKTTSDGGVVFSNSGADLTIYGGNYKSNGGHTSTGSGGVVKIGGDFIFHDGVIDATGVTANNGAAVYAADLYMNGGTIIGGTATNNGGAVYASNLYMNGGTIEGGKADNRGGAVYVSGASSEMTGGTIIGGEAKSSGGAINIYGTFTLNGGTIIAGTAGDGEGVYTYKDTGTFVMKSGVIKAAEGTQPEALIYNDNTVSLEGGKVLGNVKTGSSAEMLTISGDAEIEKIILNGADELTVGAFSGTAAIELAGSAKGDAFGLAAADAAINGTITNAECSGLTAKVDGENVVWDGTDVVVIVGEAGAYATVADALASGKTGVVKLYGDVTDNVILADGVTLVLDLNGKTLTGDITGNGTLKGMDSTNNDYVGNGKIVGTVADGLAETMHKFVDGNVTRNYLALTENGETSFHRVYLKITSTMLRPNYKVDDKYAPGIYYKVTIAGDQAVLDAIESYGVAAGKETAPTALVEGAYSSFTVAADAQPATAITANGTMIAGVMKESNETATNVTNAETKVCGVPYIVVNGETIMGAANETTLKSALSVAYELWNSGGLTHNDQITAMTEMDTAFADEMAQLGFSKPNA